MLQPGSISGAANARRNAARAARRRGAALLIVLWVSVAAGALFFASTKGFVAEIRREKASLDAVRAEAAARAGIEKARYILATLQPATDTPTPLSTLDEVDSFAGTDLEGAHYFLLDEASGDPAPALGLVDPAGRLNLNTASAAQIEALPNMTGDLAAAIVDFRDSDDNPLPYGAESAFYLGLPQPYRARNAAFTNLSELLLVRGMTPAILYGEDRNLNGILDPNENDGAQSFPPDNPDGILDRGLYPFITISSSSPARPAGTEVVNLNTDSLDSITSALGSRLSSEGMYRLMRSIYPNGTRRARRTLTSLGDLVRSFPDFATGALKADLATIFKYSTVSQNATAQGLVNVNTAPQEVLRTLPSVDDSLATAIIAERDAGGHDFSTVCWLLDVPGVTWDIFAPLVPLTSVASNLYVADCVGMSADGAVSSRIWASIDTSASGMTVTAIGTCDCIGKPVDFTTAQEAGWIGQ